MVEHRGNGGLENAAYVLAAAIFISAVALSAAVYISVGGLASILEQKSFEVKVQGEADSQASALAAQQQAAAAAQAAAQKAAAEKAAAAQAAAQAQAQQLAQIPKSDKPKSQAFVMSFCPYGLQFLKAYVPVIELLGEKADVQVDFVSYAMHGQKELEGNSYIYCVQKESKPKLASYLSCFVEAGDYKGCVATAGVDAAKIDSCVSSLDAEYNITGLYNDQSTWLSGNYPFYPVQDAENQQYGVQGSPTFVLNGQQVQVSRSPEAIKQAICAAFNAPPSECSQALSTNGEAAGLGKIGLAAPAAAAAAGGCG